MLPRSVYSMLTFMIRPKKVFKIEKTDTVESEKVGLDGREQNQIEERVKNSLKIKPNDYSFPDEKLNLNNSQSLTSSPSKLLKKPDQSSSPQQRVKNYLSKKRPLNEEDRGAPATFESSGGKNRKSVYKNVNYESSNTQNLELYNSSDVKSLNDKISSILNTKQQKSRLMQPGIKILLEEYEIPNLFKAEDFSGVRVRGGSLTAEEESSVNEKIIELLVEKIILEKENRLQTELQMNKLKSQNKKQIAVLEKMLKSSKKMKIYGSQDEGVI